MKNDIYTQYKKARGQSMPHYITTALNAYRTIKAEQKLKQWQLKIGCSNFSTYGADDVAHEIELKNGYKIIFKIIPDYDFNYFDDMKHQGYSFETRIRNKPEFAEHGQFNRHSGDGLQAYIDLSNDRDFIPALFEIPEDYIRQFYDNRNYSKHIAYSNMVKSAKLAIEQDVKNYCKTNYYIIEVSLLYNGSEVTSESIAGIDYNYAKNGAGFFEHGLYETILNELQKHIAEVKPQAAKSNYKYGFAI